MSDFRVVPAALEHYPAFAELFAELGGHDPLPDAERWAAEMLPGTLFLELEGRPVAYGYAQALSRTGYVRHVAVARERRGRGFGRATMHALAAWLRARGCERWELNVKLGNEPAIALYRSLGMETAYPTQVVRLGRELLARLAELASDAAAPATLDPASDREVERRFELPAGLIAQLRTLSGRRLVIAGDPAAPRAFACFDPRFPGCFPFRAASLPDAAALLRELAPALPAESPWIQLVLERDETLANAFLGAGAELVLEILHLEGPLP
jgi:ribosomal protein S18 acetylase RimI-like enzyme